LGAGAVPAGRDCLVDLELAPDQLRAAHERDGVRGKLTGCAVDDRPVEQAALREVADIADRPAFIPSVLGDNPHLSADYQSKSLANLDPFTRASRGNGDWKARPNGLMFRREWFPIVERMPDLFTMSVRFWDFAGSEKTNGKNPDPTASVRMHICGNIIYISDATEGYLSANDGQELMGTLAAADGVACAVRWEEELGGSGIQLTAAIKRHILSAYNADGVRVTGDKVTRAKPLSRAVEKRRVYLVRGPWNEMFLTRMCAFPIGKRDVTDASSGAFAYLEENAIGAPRATDDGHRTVTSQVRQLRGLR
jgi:phage terminase large subunit-like protein